MNLFSLVRSSAWEIMLSKRVMAALYFIVGGAVTVGAAAAAAQFFGAYIHLHQFDTQVGDFVGITLFLFLPYWFVGGLMLRASLQRMRLAFWTHRSFKRAKYKTPLSPAEAGFIVHSGFDHRDLVATLVDLHYRHAIDLSVTAESVNVQVTADGSQKLREYEQRLIMSLAGAQRAYTSFLDPALISFGEQVQNTLIEELEDRGLLRRERLPKRRLTYLFRILYVIAGIVGTIDIISVIFQYHEVMSVGYPRYAVSVSEPIVLALVLLVVAATIVSGFWPRFKQKGEEYVAWADAAGYLLYLRTVYRDRMRPEYFGTQDAETLHSVAPYAISFDIMPDDTRTVAALLSDS